MKDQDQLVACSDELTGTEISLCEGLLNRSLQLLADTAEGNERLAYIIEQARRCRIKSTIRKH